MHHHHWDTWIHFPLAAIWGSIPFWIDYIDKGGRVITILLGVAAGVLQVAYLIRKHRYLGKTKP